MNETGEALAANHKKRSSYWDNVKYAFIFLVVLGHFAEPLKSELNYARLAFDFIYTFHMPVFIYISGMFSKSAINGKRFRIERVCAFLVIYVVYKVIRYWLCMALGMPIKFDLLTEDGLPWYMLSMAFWLCMTYVVRNVKPMIMLALSILFAFIGGFFDQIGDFLALARVINYWPFFLFGYYCNPGKVDRMINKTYIKILGAVIMLALAGVILTYTDQYNSIVRLFTGRNQYTAVAEVCSWFRPWMRLAYYPYALVIGGAAISIVPHCRIPLVSEFGSRTLQIYFLHKLALYILTYAGFFIWVMECDCSDFTRLLILVVSSMLTTLLFSFKIWSYPFNAIMGLNFDKLRGNRE